VAPRAEFTPRNVQTPEERVTQTFAVKVTIDNPPETLRPGVAADVLLD
jgi:HlyD family secretion protein